MSESKHTPPPWDLEVKEDSHVILMGSSVECRWSYYRHQIVEYTHGQLSPDARDEDTKPYEFAAWEEAHANACLVMASPLLLAALERIVAAWDSIPTGADVPDEIAERDGNCMWDQARTAIAEARDILQ